MLRWRWRRAEMLTVLDAAQPDTRLKTPLAVSSLVALEGEALLLGLGAWQQSLQWRRAFVNL